VQPADKLKGWFSETKTNLVVNLRGNLAGYDRRKGDIIRTAIFDKVDPCGCWAKSGASSCHSGELSLATAA
jgi:hypothetical protein